MQLMLAHKPIAKARHRHFLRGSRMILFNPQNDDKIKTRLMIKRHLQENAIEPFGKVPLSMSLMNYCEIPASWSKKRRAEAIGAPCITRPDLDNYQKFYSDVLNEIAYADDCLIAQSWGEKLYASQPRVEIIINPIGAFMITEHALTLTGEMTAEQLDYLVKKANRSGLQKKSINRVYSIEDKEGKHIYFEIESTK